MLIFYNCLQSIHHIHYLDPNLMFFFFISLVVCHWFCHTFILLWWNKFSGYNSVYEFSLQLLFFMWKLLGWWQKFVRWPLRWDCQQRLRLLNNDWIESSRRHYKKHSPPAWLACQMLTVMVIVLIRPILLHQ